MSEAAKEADAYRGARPLLRKVGVENPLLVPERTGEVAPVRTEDRRPAAAHDLVALGEWHVVRIARRALEDATAQDKRARLARDVLHRVVPILRVVRRRRKVDL